MVGTLDSCIPLPVDEALLKEVISKAKDWALMHGAGMRSKDGFSEDSLQVIFILAAVRSLSVPKLRVTLFTFVQ